MVFDPLKRGKALNYKSMNSCPSIVKAVGQNILVVEIRSSLAARIDNLEAVEHSL